MKALILMSGGVDSATCLGLAIREYGRENVLCLSIFYGQKHTRENEAAFRIAKHYQVELIQLDLARIFEYSDCSLLRHSDGVIPHESYSAQLDRTGGAPFSTYVPFRNGLFLSVAASLALSRGSSVIYYGAHGDDAAGNAYPDCSQAFNQSMNQAIVAGSGEQVEIIAPFVSWNKAEVVQKGLELGVPFELTWSCYEGGEEPCGSCGTCRDRQKAFESNGVPDPAMNGNSQEKQLKEAAGQ